MLGLKNLTHIRLFRLLDLSDLTAKIPEVYGATIKAKQVATSII